MSVRILLYNSIYLWMTRQIVTPYVPTFFALREGPEIRSRNNSPHKFNKTPHLRDDAFSKPHPEKSEEVILSALPPMDRLDPASLYSESFYNIWMCLHQGLTGHLEAIESSSHCARVYANKQLLWWSWETWREVFLTSLTELLAILEGCHWYYRADTNSERKQVTLA